MKIRNLLILLFALGLSAIANAKVHDGLEVKVKAVNAQQANNEDVYVKVSYKNISDSDIQILRWYLPDSQGTIEEAIFTITRDGEAVDYLGRHYKRPAPTTTDYVTLKPNQKLKFTVELSRDYDISEQGLYQIEVSAKNFDLFTLNNNNKSLKGPAPWEMHSDASTEIYVTKVSQAAKRCNPRKEDCGGGGGGSGDVSFTGACSNSEQSSVLSALSEAKNIANDSVSYLNGSSGPRYTTWFGTYSSTRWNKVAGNFDSIKDALDNKSKTFDCSCNQSYYAYVYPNQPYTIYLCRAFWSASTTGTDSKSGTIIHEMSHFNVVAGTDDIVYGQTGAKNLAISNPDSAIQNADSHEYFAENKPAQN